MATHNATNYGSKVHTSPYGERYDFVSDLNGGTSGELMVKMQTKVDQRLYEIAYMRSEIARSPLEGDDVLLDYLEVDEVLVRRGGHSELLIDTYPELPSRIQELIKEIVSIGESIDGEKSTHIPDDLTVEDFLVVLEEEITDPRPKDDFELAA